jgi:hypothetical protein
VWLPRYPGSNQHHSLAARSAGYSLDTSRCTAPVQIPYIVGVYRYHLRIGPYSFSKNWAASTRSTISRDVETCVACAVIKPLRRSATHRLLRKKSANSVTNQIFQFSNCDMERFVCILIQNHFWLKRARTTSFDLLWSQNLYFVATIRFV